jgi:hypothetical protein
MPMFDDDGVDAYWDSTNPQNSTKTANSGVTIEVTEQSSGGSMTISVNNPSTP